MWLTMWIFFHLKNEFIFLIDFTTLKICSSYYSPTSLVSILNYRGVQTYMWFTCFHKNWDLLVIEIKVRNGKFWNIMEKSINKLLANIIGYSSKNSHSLLTLDKLSLALNSPRFHFKVHFLLHKKLFLKFLRRKICDFMKGLMLHEWENEKFSVRNFFSLSLTFFRGFCLLKIWVNAKKRRKKV